MSAWYLFQVPHSLPLVPGLPISDVEVPDEKALQIATAISVIPNGMGWPPWTGRGSSLQLHPQTPPLAGQ